MEAEPKSECECGCYCDFCKSDPSTLRSRALKKVCGKLETLLERMESVEARVNKLVNHKGELNGG